MSIIDSKVKEIMKSVMNEIDAQFGNDLKSLKNELMEEYREQTQKFNDLCGLIEEQNKILRDINAKLTREE